MEKLIDFLAIFSNWVIDFLMLFIFLRVILSWFPIPPGRFTNFLKDMTNPIFRLAAQFPFARIGILDLTPLFAYFGLEIVAWALQKLFLTLGANPGIYLVG